MGSAYSWCLTIENRNPSLEEMIFDAANSSPDFSDCEPEFQNWMWFRWTPEVKWWAGDFVIQLSKQIRDTVFRLEASGDQHFVWFYLNGEILDEKEIWNNPQFPSRPLFKKKMSEAKINREKVRQQREEVRAKAEKERLQKEIETLKTKQADLERKLAG